MTETKPPAPWRNVLRVVTWVVLAVVVYPLSVLAVVSAYWLKTEHGYNVLEKGGWHAFSSCLVREIPVDAVRVK